MVPSPSGEQRKAERRKTKIVTLVTAIVTAATPGVYSAWQTAKNAHKQKVEQKTRDTQETDLQKNVAAAQSELTALSKSCVTHKDLVDLIVKLRDTRRSYRPHRPHTNRSPRTQPQPNAREEALLAKIAALKAKSRVATKARKKADVVRKAAPKLRPVKLIRQQVQKQLAE
jgi:hypothetical protein